MHIRKPFKKYPARSTREGTALVVIHLCLFKEIVYPQREQNDDTANYPGNRFLLFGNIDVLRAEKDATNENHIAANNAQCQSNPRVEAICYAGFN